MIKKKKRNIVLSLILILIIIYGLTYIPHKVVNINPSDVSKIIIFSGNTGKRIEITEEVHIKYIVNNLNNVTFKKDKISLGYVGYSFDTTMYNKKGKIIKNLIINSKDTIRYRGFFYRAKEKEIDYNYIEKQFER